MRFRIRPVDTSFYDLFTESANHLVRGVSLLAEMLSDTADREDVARRMRDAEHAADEATHEIVKKVNSTFVTPFDREDIYALGSGLDDVMDSMDEVVDQIFVYGVNILPPELSDQVTVLQRCAELTAAAMPKLRSMKELSEYWIEINRLENQGDKNHRRILAKLFSGEYDAMEVLKLKDIVESLEDAIELMKLKEVVDALEAAADSFEKVANHVETVALKES